MTKHTAMFLVGLVGCAADVPDRIPEDGMSGARDAQGAAGPAGERGVQGPMGLPGKDAPASAWRPLGHFGCLATLDIIGPNADRTASIVTKDGLNETVLDYSVTVYENGDADVDCSASLGSASEGGDSNYYPAPTAGSQSRYCFGDSDYPSANPGTDITAGGWRFTTGPSPQAEYRDSDNPLGLNGLAYVFSEDDCASFTMDDTGAWTRATLAAVL